MSWKHEEQVRDWKGRPVTLGIDLDGDIGILDDHGYSIIIKRDQALMVAAYFLKCFDPNRTPSLGKTDAGCGTES